MLNIIAPEASALIGGCRALQRLAVPAAMGMPLRFRSRRRRGAPGPLARADIRHRAAPLPLPTRGSPLAPNLA
ncbi:hypothetical protein XAR_4249 [Xanthomonas citri pv. glycines str. 8ra]|nr:hypothetical protein XAR_4249 [Xanthomonas citri pv. glycines str. 8ra]